MTEPTLQQIVDTLATRLGRSVAIDDPGMRLKAVSRHFGDADEIAWGVCCTATSRRRTDVS